MLIEISNVHKFRRLQLEYIAEIIAKNIYGNSKFILYVATSMMCT